MSQKVGLFMTRRDLSIDLDIGGRIILKFILNRCGDFE
jgi:hypothetical protein